MQVGADREEILNGQVNQLNFKGSGKLFQMKCDKEKNRESSPEGEERSLEEHISRDLVRRTKN